MILVIDNYDSFVHNLARYFERLGVPTRVVRNDAVSVADVRQLEPQAIVLSPGPCTPDEAGVSLELVAAMHKEMPILGVCLGHQAIAQALGGRVIRGRRPWHGRASEIEHVGEGLFQDIPSPTKVGRYHSLVADVTTLPEVLVPTAWTVDERTLMAFAHRELPVMGVQFHPESVLTECGYAMLANFLQLAGIEFTGDPAELTQSELAPPAPEWTMPTRPVTF
jgi:anthranilate synthase/aminodeoxychorismate synthase-like glutamine amidotransferase